MPLDTAQGAAKTYGNYELGQKIAEGGMGSVYRARHVGTGEQFAIKVLSAHLVANQVLLQRFEQEFRAAGKLDHPNIVRAIDYGVENGVPYLVMELVEGETLGQRVERGGRLGEAEAIRIALQVAQGLHQAHAQGIIHRDVKPDNILLTPTGEAKLADLGLVKDAEGDLNLTRTGRGLGTPHFMSPEQFRNAKHADVRCDIYSLAASLYMAVTGELPFRSCSPLDAWMKKINNDLPAPCQMVPTLSPRLDWAIRRGMSADPDKRPASCKEFAEDLLGRSIASQTDFSVLAEPPPSWYVRYRDVHGAVQRTQGDLNSLRRALQMGRLGNPSAVQVSATEAGPDLPLRAVPEWRDLVIQPAALLLNRGAAREVSRSPSSADLSSSRAATSQARQAPAAMPNLDLQPVHSGLDWMTWLLVVLFAAAGFLLGFLLLSQ